MGQLILNGEKSFKLDDIKAGDSTGLTAEVNGALRMLLAVRKGDKVFVYINSCPHIGMPLDFHVGNFLCPDKKYILCSTHGALFEIENGRCIFGPCQYANLEVVPVTIEDGNVMMAL